VHRIARDDPQRPHAGRNRAVEAGATSWCDVAVDHERAAHDRHRDDTPFGCGR
jgi:hypothetical protein